MEAHHMPRLLASTAMAIIPTLCHLQETTCALNIMPTGNGTTFEQPSNPNTSTQVICTINVGWFSHDTIWSYSQSTSRVTNSFEI